MLNTTLGYIEKDGCYLMLHRIKKENDINHDKWIGIGGKQEMGETILDCMQRECKEETGLEWKDPQLKGIVTFNFWETPDSDMFCEQMFLYTGGSCSGSLKDCQEGVLEWVPICKLAEMPTWFGDYLFLDLLQQDIPLFYLQLDYVGDKLTKAILNNQEVSMEEIAASKERLKNIPFSASNSTLQDNLS